MKKTFAVALVFSFLLPFLSAAETNEKNVIYQLFVRTFSATGNTREQVGSFNAINENALSSLSRMGINTIWLTGIMEHASPLTDDPDIIKGNAGSPYAIRDYYDIHHEYGTMRDFKALVRRIHGNGMRVVIDLVANHTSRNNVVDIPGKEHMAFGIADNPSEFFNLGNNYYYVKPDSTFTPPRRFIRNSSNGLVYDGVFDKDILLPGIQYEYPAKVTGNNIAIPNPDFNTWFETVKLNYGFDFRHGGAHYYPGNPLSIPFSQLPSTWRKMIDIITYWLDKGVDGFRCDIANMVPLAFWKTAIYYARKNHPDALFIMEAYEGGNDPIGYSHKGMFSAGANTIYAQPVYDAAKAVYQSNADAINIGDRINELFSKIGSSSGRYVFYMENHDQIRVAGRHFKSHNPGPRYGYALSKFLFGLPGSFMLYNGQEVGETGEGNDGLDGDDGKTTIFDYHQMPVFAGWFNNGRYDGGNLSSPSTRLRESYAELFKLADLPALAADHSSGTPSFVNLNDLNAGSYNFRRYISAYARFKGRDRYIVVANLDPDNSQEATIHFTSNWQDVMGILGQMKIQNSSSKNYCFRDVFTGFTPSDPNTVHHGSLTGSELWRPHGVPSGLYLGKIPPLTVYYLKIDECSPEN